jgi:hypothetical protein
METPILKENHDLEDDSYNNLLIVEKKIKELQEKGLLDNNEILVIDYISQGYFYEDIERITGIGRVTVSKIFTEVCGKLAFYLGGEFTDAGTIYSLTEKYHLNDEQVEKLEDYIISRYRHKIRHTDKETKND